VGQSHDRLRFSKLITDRDKFANPAILDFLTRFG